MMAVGSTLESTEGFSLVSREVCQIGMYISRTSLVPREQLVTCKGLRLGYG